MDLPPFRKFDFNGWGFEIVKDFCQVNACHDFIMKLAQGVNSVTVRGDSL